MRLVLLLVALLSVPASAQVTLPRPPRVSLPSGGRDLPPLQGSAARAYAYSAAATVGGIGAGYVLYRVLPDARTDGEFAPRTVGLSVVALAAVLGPTVGNSTLGADDDARRAVLIKSGSLAAGATLAFLGGGLCAVASFDGSPGDGCYAMFYGGIGIAAVGFVAGTAIDLSTIPRNAARAREERQQRTVTVAPSGAGLSVRVPL